MKKYMCFCAQNWRVWNSPATHKHQSSNTECTSIVTLCIHFVTCLLTQFLSIILINDLFISSVRHAGWLLHKRLFHCKTIYTKQKRNNTNISSLRVGFGPAKPELELSDTVPLWSITVTCMEMSRPFKLCRCMWRNCWIHLVRRVLPANRCSISSRVFPSVSGNRKYKKAKQKQLMMPKNQKEPYSCRLCSVLRYVLAAMKDTM